MAVSRLQTLESHECCEAATLNRVWGATRLHRRTLRKTEQEKPTSHRSPYWGHQVIWHLSNVTVLHPSIIVPIFFLGVVLYEMLTGELPGSKLQPPSRKVEIDVRLDEIVLRALEKQPELRFQTASDFRTHVTTFVSVESISDLKPTTICQPMIARGMVSTPEKLATLWGIFVVGRNSGEFVLDQTQLSIRRSANLIRSGETIVICGKSIQAVEVDRDPAMVSFVGLDFVRVTYLSDGQTRQVCFTPSSGTWASIAARESVRRGVGRCHSRVEGREECR